MERSQPCEGLWAVVSSIENLSSSCLGLPDKQGFCLKSSLWEQRRRKQRLAGSRMPGCGVRAGRAGAPSPVVGIRRGRGAAEQVELEILPRADRRATGRKLSCPAQTLPLSAILRGRASRLTSLEVQPRVAVYTQRSLEPGSQSLEPGSQSLPLAHTCLVCTPNLRE